MLRTKIRQTSGIKINKMFNSNNINKGRSKYFAVIAIVSAVVILFKHFKDFRLEPLVDDEDNAQDPDWWSLSPLWSEDGLPHINPHPFRFLNNNPDICRKESKTDILILVIHKSQ